MSNQQESTAHDGEHDDHHETTIIVNTRRKVVSGRQVSFDQVVHLAFDNPPSGPDVVFTITYRGGPEQNPAGQLTEGHSVSIKEGMVFNVVPTDKS